ncbi:hypothetical protein AOQ84DRAFT_382667 [Glonium stellatum]|uniref:Carrier domain-containing protein n=1 Tax=Glonium stellatum TaxID=574774 RepID=A0A8E2JM46_9PEZI|nr:hypothetical protein AOQ84DRAFT_382667 [Glonium stellatum]
MASVDLTTIMTHKPKKLGQLIRESILLLEQGKIKVAQPTYVLNYTQIEESFRALQSGKSTGKMVFKPSPEDIVPIIPQALVPLQFSKDASYILAGGLSRLGRSAASEAARKAVEGFQTKGCNIHIFSCDVTEKFALSNVIEQCKATLPPIKGCIQGSMVLKNVYLGCTRFLESAQSPSIRHGLFLASVVSNRNSWKLGYVAENKDILKTIPTISSVLESLREDEIHSIIEYQLDPRASHGQTSYQTVSGLTSATLYKQRGMPPPTYLSYPLFTHLQAESDSIADQGMSEDMLISTSTQLSAASSIEDATAIISDSIRIKLSKLLAIAVDDIDPSRSISSNGVDSLVATEFRTWLAKELRADVPILDIMGTSSISGFSSKVTGLSKLVPVGLSLAGKRDGTTENN